MSWIYAYDASRANLEFVRRQLEMCGIDGSQLSLFSNRIELFEAIDAAEHTVVALIDLQSDDRTDNNYSGHRIIDTIRRHPRLRERCVAIAHTVHVREDVIALVRSHGASALISKHDLDVADPERFKPSLLEFLEEQRDRLSEVHPTEPAGAGDPEPNPLVDIDIDIDQDYPIFPDVERAKEELALEEATTLVAIDSLLTRRPRILREPYFWQAISYFADNIEQASVAHWIHHDVQLPERSIVKAIDELAQSLAPLYRVRKVAWADFARDLLALLSHKRLALLPGSIEAVRRLPRVSELEAVLRDPVIRRASYLDEVALDAIDLVVDPIVGVGHTSGNVGAWKHTDDLIERLCELEPDEKARVALQIDFVRAVSNMWDTYLAFKELDAVMP